MKRLAFIIAIFVFVSFGCTAETVDTESDKLLWPDYLPVYDHVVIVVEENKDYDEVIGDATGAIYINDTLKAQGANFLKVFGEEHYSQGNYFWLFSGSDQGVGFRDNIPDSSNPNYPFEASNLGQQLIKEGFSFKGYAESLPQIGDKVHTAGIDSLCPDGIFFGRSHDPLYGRKHVPWISFANVPNGTTVETSSNLRFSDFPTESSDFWQLPTVSIVIPNLHNDMHNCSVSESVPTGDRWLRENLDGYYQWAKKNNSLLILTFDENNDTGGKTGLTNPADTSNIILENRIVTIFAGAHIKQGDYYEGKGITHVNILRTLEAMYGLSKSGAQQPFAVKAGIRDDYIITDVFKPSR